MQANPNTISITKLSDYKIFIFLALVLGISIASNSFISASFWLDECISAWISSEGTLHAFSRSWNFQGQSPLYYVLISLWINIFGKGELAIRLFSLCSICLTTIVLFRLIKKYISTIAAITCCFVFLCQDPTQLALSARPYALGVLFCLLTLRSLLSVLDKQNLKPFRSTIAFAIYATLAIYSHYFAALSIGVFAIISILYGLANRIIRLEIIFASIIIFILCLPLLPQLQLLQNKAAEIAFAPPLNINQIFESIVPLFPSLAFIIACVGSAAISCEPIQKIFCVNNPRLSLLGIAAGWWLLPILMLLILSIISGTSFLIPRYLTFSTPAFAIIISIVFSQIRYEKQLSILIILTCLLGIRELNRNWVIEDWRGSIQAARAKDNPILLASGLAELNHISWLNSESTETQKYLLSPLLVYAPKQTGVPIPNSLENEELKKYFIEKLNSSLESTSKIFLIFKINTSFLVDIKPILADLNLHSKLSTNGIIATLEISR